jgi:hypothetical protein
MENDMLVGRHFQNAYITRDIDKAVAALKGRADIREFMQFEVTTDVTSPTGPGQLTNKLAFIWVGDMQYEIIQPVGGKIDVYVDALPADDSLRFHHSCMRVDDWDEFRAQVDRQPLPVVLEGGFDGLKWLYLDARPLVGHYLEYGWMTDKSWRQLGGR